MHEFEYKQHGLKCAFLPFYAPRILKDSSGLYTAKQVVFNVRGKVSFGLLHTQLNLRPLDPTCSGDLSRNLIMQQLNSAAVARVCTH